MIEFTVIHEGEVIKLQFEHSLRSMSKWESKHCIAFLGREKKNGMQMFDYYKCMLLTPDVDPDLVLMLEPDQLEALTEYINTSQTASSVPDDGTPQTNLEITTSELVYFWMTALKINWEAQDWHFSRLMMLIQITSYKQQPPKKKSPSKVMSAWRAENERRKKLFNTSG